MNFSFDANNIPTGDDARLEHGKQYVFTCERAELKTTRAGDGTYVNTQFVVADGPCEGKTVWGRFTFENKSMTAVKIGREQLAELCKAIDRPQIDSTAQLEGIAFLGTVKATEETYKGKTSLKFTIDKFEACDAQTQFKIQSKIAAAKDQTQPSDDQVPF